MNIFRLPVNKDDYFVAEYWLESQTNLHDAAWNLAIGQSVGNPHVRNQWETQQLFEEHSCLVIDDNESLKTQKSGIVHIAFPLANIDIDTDGVSQLLCHLMGGQMDMENILSCQLIDVEFPECMLKSFKGPKFGLSGARDFLGVYGKPLLGGIVKPKVGITPDTLLELVKEMVEGGVDFIKEDEIMSNPPLCPLEVRVPLIMNYLKDKKAIYAVCINSDAPHVLNRARRVYELGGKAIHVNFWSGLGTYKAIRDLDLPLFLHFQKSGDKILTNSAHQFHVRWNFICKLAAMMGVDFIHAGMIGGYYNARGDDMHQVMDTLRKGNVVAALSCGMHPGLIEGINKRIGVDYMANCGGAIHGHPGGTLSGVRAMKQAINGDHGQEYHQAILKWGKGELC